MDFGKNSSVNVEIVYIDIIDSKERVSSSVVSRVSGGRSFKTLCNNKNRTKTRDKDCKFFILRVYRMKVFRNVFCFCFYFYFYCHFFCTIFAFT
jgi:hypothetical protein